MQLVAFKHLLGLLQGLQCPLLCLVNKEGEPPRLARVHVEPQSPGLDLAELGKEGLELVGGSIGMDVADIDPAALGIRMGGPGAAPGGDGTDGGELRVGESFIGLKEGLNRHNNII